MTKKQRTEQILSDLDASIAHGKQAIRSADVAIADPNSSAERKRQAESARGITARRVADHAQMAAQLRSGEIDCYDDNFSGRQR